MLGNRPIPGHRVGPVVEQNGSRTQCRMSYASKGGTHAAQKTREHCHDDAEAQYYDVDLGLADPGDFHRREGDDRANACRRKAEAQHARGEGSERTEDQRDRNRSLGELLRILDSHFS